METIRDTYYLTSVLFLCNHFFWRPRIPNFTDIFVIPLASFYSYYDLRNSNIFFTIRSLSQLSLNNRDP